ncbi:MAG: hypothetical protein ACI81L_000428 [Verrucomicrobiales bacterium]|jgi:hypothetical protein
MILASLEVWHSRPIAPTRRVALGDSDLPTDPAPGAGGLLLGAVLARFASQLDAEMRAEMLALMNEVERGQRIGQPRLRHRLQADRVGLGRSRHRLVAGPDGLRFELETAKGLPAQSALAAVYAVGGVPIDRRTEIMAVLRRGLDWVGPVGSGLIEHLVGADVAMRMRSGAYSIASDPLIWAMGVLELDGGGDDFAPRDIQRSYRRLVRDAHPDHGAGRDDAADRIAELSRAREILLP